MGQKGSRDYTICVCGNLAFVQTSPLRTATFGVPYRLTLKVSGGKGPYRFEITGGNLPVWLFLSPEGVLSGTPGDDGGITAAPNMVFVPGTEFTVTATDTIAGCPSVSREFNVPVRVCPNAVTIKTITLPNGTKGTAYSAPIAVAGGAAPVSLDVVSGSLPPDLVLTAGKLLGIPTAIGTYTFGLVATDAAECSSAPQDYTVVIGSPSGSQGGQ